MNLKFFFLAFSVLFLAVLIVFVLFSSKGQESQLCPIQIKTEIVHGSSMEPLIERGKEIKALFGYYDCHSIKRNDIVLVNYSGNENFLIKIVKAVPGDEFHLQKAENGWCIVINGKILKNSEGVPYLLSKRRKKMLSLYENDYQGIIPEGAYLVLGNIPSGSVDSTKFGLIGKSAIIAEVKFKRQFSNFLDSYLNSFYNIFK